MAAIALVMVVGFIIQAIAPFMIRSGGPWPNTEAASVGSATRVRAKGYRGRSDLITIWECDGKQAGRGRRRDSPVFRSHLLPRLLKSAPLGAVGRSAISSSGAKMTKREPATMAGLPGNSGSMVEARGQEMARDGAGLCESRLGRLPSNRRKMRRNAKT